MIRTILAVLLLTVTCPAQTVTINGLALSSPTLINLQTPMKSAPYVHFRGDYAMVSRVEDKEWDGPGVAVLQVTFQGRDPIDPPVPFYIEARQGTCMALTVLDLNGVVCERRCIRVDRRDYDLDQIPSVLDFWAFQRGWEAGDDFNRDGATDVRDFIDYLNGWRE